ncbi:hypothetical protein [Streptomyces sp. AHA2]|uniref:hypothetical protein n=1 Tax=Streptomyces sp. AHA2 TaxID=3064526 RepID=UPI002FE0B116
MAKQTAQYKGTTFTRTSARRYTHVVVIERDGEFIDARWSMSPEAAAKRLPHGWEAERVATVEVTPEGAEEIQPTHVSELDTDSAQAVESPAQDNTTETRGRTMAAKKLKLKDVRGDVRIGAVPGADAIHALRNDVDERGRNLPMCTVRTKAPIQYWGPAMDQKPELELCAGCSKVVPTGDVIVTEEPVQVPGLDLTVTQKKITPVEDGAEAAYTAAFESARALGADHAEAADRASAARDAHNKGENMPAAAKKTAAKKAEAPATDTAETNDVDGTISDVHATIDQIKAIEPGSEGAFTQASKLKSEAEDKIRQLPTAKRNTLRADLNAAFKVVADQKPADAPSTEVAVRGSAEVADDFYQYDGVKKLVTDGVKYLTEGLDLGLKLGNVGQKLAHTILDVRTRIPNPDANDLPDLMADRKTTKNAAAEIYEQAKKGIADDDVERLAAHASLVRASQNKMSDVLVEWLESFDGPERLTSIDVARGLFPGVAERAEADPELKISDAIRELYASHGITLPRYGRTELARYDRRVKALEAAEKKKEALVESTEPGAEAELQEVNAKIEELKGEIPADYLSEKLAPKPEKTDAEKTKEALDALKAQVEKAGKRFAKVKGANEKRKAKAEVYAIIRAAADAFELDLSALVTSDEE